MDMQIGLLVVTRLSIMGFASTVWRAGLIIVYALQFKFLGRFRSDSLKASLPEFHVTYSEIGIELVEKFS